MRLNAYIALNTGVSRRAADKLISQGYVRINGSLAEVGQQIRLGDSISVSSPSLKLIHTVDKEHNFTTIALNKPEGYVCSRNGQGSKTIYDLLPRSLHHLKPIGRLDKDSSGLILLTNDGKLAQSLSHPKYQKEKTYEVTIDRPFQKEDMSKLLTGIQLPDGISKFQSIRTLGPKSLEVVLTEGRNRQIRRTFAAIGYKVTRLNRTSFGDYKLGTLKSGQFKRL